MSFDPLQFRLFVWDTLYAVDPPIASGAAVPLVLGTIAHESDFGRFLWQVQGPARGCCQMEEPTFDWLKDVYADKYPIVSKFVFSRIHSDLRMAVIMCRLRYRVVPHPLPSGDSIDDLAAYWKKWYNTELGAGTVEQFKASYVRHLTT